VNGAARAHRPATEGRRMERIALEARPARARESAQRPRAEGVRKIDILLAKYSP